MITSLHQPQLLQGYYEEFLKQIKGYQNVVRPSVFVKYFNINVGASIFKEEAESTYDTYHDSKVLFDIYELTPLYFVGPINNAVANVTDLDGQRVDGATTATLYTIKRPKIGDLISFLDPIQSKEIFRLTGVRTSVNLVHSTTPAEWFEVDLDYAPIKDTSGLKINNRYAYDMSLEQNLLYNNYVQRIEWLNEISENLKVINPYYDFKEDCYVVNGVAASLINEVVYLVKKEFDNRWLRLFEETRAPFGYRLLSDLKYNSFSDIVIDPQNIAYEVVDMVTGEVEQYVYGNDSELDTVIDSAKRLHEIMVNSPWINRS
jgi:hypothetical protein